jgi:hypothetical protein
VTSGASIDQRFCEYKRGRDRITTEGRIFSAQVGKAPAFQGFYRSAQGRVMQRIACDTAAGTGPRNILSIRVVAQTHQTENLRCVTFANNFPWRFLPIKAGWGRVTGSAPDIMAGTCIFMVQGAAKMTFRNMVTAGLVAAFGLAAAGCTTTGVPKNPVEARWNGQQAGTFFARFGPPVSDAAAGNSTLYTWRGGFKTRVIPATYEDLGNGKKGKLLTQARTQYLRCEVQLSVSSDYVIRSVRTVVDRPGVDGGSSYCAEFLAGN